MKAFVSSPRIGALITVSTLLSLLVGCGQPDWSDAEYVKSKLTSEDSVERLVALSKISDMRGPEQAKYKDLLIKMYLEKKGKRKDIISILIPMKDEAAKEAYLTELETNDGGKAAKAAVVLGEMKAKDAISKMLQVLATTDNTEVQQGIMQGLAKMPDPQMASALRKVLELDADNNPIALHSYSCDILGEIALAKPEAISSDVRDAMIRGIFLSNIQRQNVAKECGLAVQKLGKPAVAGLVRAFKLERPDLLQLMMTYDMAINFPKGVAAARLTAMHAPEAVDLFVEDIPKKKEIPKLLKGNAGLKWVQAEGQAHSEMIRGLGDLGDSKALGVLSGILMAKYDKELDKILDFAVETQLRQDAANAIRSIGDRKGAKVLMEATMKGKIIDLEKLAAKNPKMAPARRWTFQMTTARAYANLAGADGAQGLKKIHDASRSSYFRKYIGLLLAMPQTFAECDGKGADAAKAACYGAKLRDKNDMVREKAAFELRRLPSAVAAPELVKGLSTPFLDAREHLTAGLYLHPSKDAIAAIDKIIKDEESLGAPAYRQDRVRLRLLQAWLKKKYGVK